MNAENEIRVRVISQEKGFYRISNGTAERLAEVSGKFRYLIESLSDFPAVGDYVLATWPKDGSNSIISSVFPRRSAFIRKAAGQDAHEQVVAANIDTIFVCMSLNNDFNLRRLERYLATAWDSGATPVIVLTKADLCSDLSEKIMQVQSVAMGVEVLTVSSLNEDVEAVRPFLQPAKTIAFLGSSGVGKSTLINKLLGQDVLLTSGIRSDDKGHHTTTRRELLTLACGTYVIDTPGMRELGMWDHETGVENTFADIEELIAQCRFSDCRHNGEPGCAVLSALKKGTLQQERWNSYQKLKTESAYAADEAAYLAAKRQKFKEISKINRIHGKRS